MSGEVYRLTHFHEGKDLAVAIRLELGASSGTLSVVELAVLSGAIRGEAHVANHRMRELSAAEVGDVGRTIAASGFWRLETSEDRRASRWLLEGRRDGGYHVVQRISCTKSPVREICLALLALADRGDIAERW
jgi:hypothetical protein